MAKRPPSGWIKLPVDYYQHPKVCGLTPVAEVLFIHALAYCGQHGTDGFIPKAMLGRLATGRPGASAQELCDAGLWEPCDDGRDGYLAIENY